MFQDKLVYSVCFNCFVVEQPKISSENVQTNLGVAEEVYNW